MTALTLALYRNLFAVIIPRNCSLISRLQHSVQRNPSSEVLTRGEFLSGAPRILKVINYHCSSMTSKMDNLLNDPRRHFDYQTLILKKKESAMLIIDVRQPEELVATGTIPDSINIPLSEVEDALGMTPEAFRMRYGLEKPTKGSLIVFSCQSGRRSLTALGRALFHGYLNAGNFKGGWLEWEANTRQQ